MFESPKTSTDARSAPEQVFLWFVAASPFACMFVGVAALAGWVFGIESLRSCFFPDGNSIKATTAVLLILAGAALVRLPKPSKSPKSVLAAFSGLVLLGVAGAP